MAGRSKRKSKSYAHLPTREAVLVIAENLCAQKGPEAVQVQEIARELGVRPPSLYSHFSGRDAILECLAELGASAVLETFEDLQNLRADEAMRVQISREIGLYIARPGLARLFLADLSAPGGSEEFNKIPNAISALLCADEVILDRGVKEGVFDQVDVRVFLAVKMGAILNALVFEWFRGEQISYQRRAKLSTTLSDWMLSVVQKTSQ